MRLNSFRFVHAADLHLDSPFVSFRSNAPEAVTATLREATFEAYDAIIDLCIVEHVDALLVAGDVYDGADKSLRAQLRFVEGLRRLSAAGIRSFICHGNHDPLDGWEAGFATPPGCHRFGDRVEAVPLDPDNPRNAVVYGYSYPKQKVTENVARQFQRSDHAAFAIGLLHCNVGSNASHYPYAPCTVEDLAATGMDYWALGHVHTREVVRQQGPAIVYPGNPQGRQPNETGARGVYLVDVDTAGRTSMTFRALDRVRWTTLGINIGEIEDGDGLQAAIESAVADALLAAERRPIVYRLELTGRGPLHRSIREQDGYLDELREITNDQWARRRQFAWCERVIETTTPAFDRDHALAAGDFLAEVLREFDDSEHEASLIKPLAELYRQHAAAEYLRDVMPTVADLPALLRAAETVSLDHLLEEPAK